MPLPLTVVPQPFPLSHRPSQQLLHPNAHARALPWLLPGPHLFACCLHLPACLPACPPALAQLPLIYQPVDQLYCTQARYVPLNPEDPLEGLQVINFSRKGGVSGEPVSTGAGPS